MSQGGTWYGARHSDPNARDWRLTETFLRFELRRLGSITPLTPPTPPPHRARNSRLFPCFMVGMGFGRCFFGHSC